MKKEETINLIKLWLKENTKGLKNLDKNNLIFSYNDIKYDLINYIREA